MLANILKCKIHVFEEHVSSSSFHHKEERKKDKTHQTFRFFSFFCIKYNSEELVNYLKMGAEIGKNSSPEM
jgi:hypothetical protein